MWIRIACPNGHALTTNELRFAARTGSCPQCYAIVSMWVKVNCPNGHGLKVRTKHSGKTGKCPECSAPVPIPKLDEEAVLALIGKEKAAAAEPLPVHQDPRHAGNKPPEPGESSMLKVGSTLLKRLPKTCPSCKQQMSPKYQICPHCRTYLPFADVGEAAEFVGAGHATIHCPSCGTASFPGSKVCTNCGVQLVD